MYFSFKKFFTLFIVISRQSHEESVGLEEDNAEGKIPNPPLHPDTFFILFCIENILLCSIIIIRLSGYAVSPSWHILALTVWIL